MEIFDRSRRVLFEVFFEAASQFSPDIFVAHDLPMLPVARLACKSNGAKLVYDSHELYSEQEFSRRERRRWTEIEAKHIGACNAVITINPSIASELERRYNIQGVNVIYNAERCALSLSKERLFHLKYGLASKTKILLFQGGLFAGRNLEVLVRAMLHVRNPWVNLVIVGDGPLQQSLFTIVKTLGLSRRVHLHPAVPQEILTKFSASADAGVIPYQPTCLNNYYCTPNKLFEFIAAGLPVLASDLPELRRLVCSLGIGLVGNMSTSERVALLIDEFFKDMGRIGNWRQQVDQARRIVCWEKEGEKLTKIFEALE